MSHITIQVNENRTDAKAGQNAASSLLANSVGKVITGTISGTRQQPKIQIGKLAIDVSSDVVGDRNVGDSMDFLVTKQEQSVVLKAMQEFVGGNAEGEEETYGQVSRLQVMRNTEQFAQIAKESDISIEGEEKAQESAAQAARISEEDLAMLRRMGIDAANTDVSHLMGLINQYHAQQEGRSFQTGSPEVVAQIARAQTLPALSEGAMRYLIDQQEPLTYDVIYKAEYSAVGEGIKDPLTEEEKNQLAPQIEKQLQLEELPVSDDTVQAATWLIEHALPVEKQNVERYLLLKDWNENGGSFKQNYEKNLIAAAQVTGELRNAVLIGEEPAKKAQEMIEDLSTTSASDVAAVVRKGQPLTLYNIVEAAKQPYNESNAAFSEEEQNRIEQGAVTLKELRIRMTLQAGYALFQKYPDLMSQELEQVAVELQELNRETVSYLYPDTESDLYEETMAKVEVIPQLPVATLGHIAQQGRICTLDEVYETGMKDAVAMELAAAKQGAEQKIASYETLMTAPRADMGDSIAKAFANIGSMFDEMGMENSEENRRAVRILSYNQMAVTKEQVEQIKALDERLTSVVESMKPEIVMGMIRDRVNPLHLSLEALSDEIKKQEKKQGSKEEETYSEYLYRLSHEADITPEERESYIGVYRLLRMVTEFDSRELGALMKNGEELSLKNLLKAERSRKKHGMDVTISDAEEERRSGGFKYDVTEQLERAFAAMKEKDLFTASQQEQLQDEVAKAQQELLKQLPFVSEESYHFLMTQGQPMTPQNLLAAEQLTKEQRDFYRNIKRELKQRGYDDTKAFSDLEETMFDDLLSSEEEKEKQAKIRTHMQDAFWDAYHETDEKQIFTAKDVWMAGQIHTRMSMAASLGQKQEYFIPVVSGDDVYTMHVSFADGEEQGYTAVVETKGYGTVTAKAVIRETGSDISVTSSDEQGNEILQQNKEGLQKVFAPLLDENSKKACYASARAFVELVRSMQKQ